MGAAGNLEEEMTRMMLELRSLLGVTEAGETCSGQMDFPDFLRTMQKLQDTNWRGLCTAAAFVAHGGSMNEETCAVSGERSHHQSLSQLEKRPLELRRTSKEQPHRSSKRSHTWMPGKPAEPVDKPHS